MKFGTAIVLKKSHVLSIEYIFFCPWKIKMNADEMNIWGRAWQIEHSIELHSSGLTGAANHSDMQKIRIIGFFFFK